MQTVLIVDDERKIGEIAGDFLRHAGFDVVTADSGAAGLEAARTRIRRWSSSICGCPTSTASASRASCGASRTSRS